MISLRKKQMLKNSLRLTLCTCLFLWIALLSIPNEAHARSWQLTLGTGKLFSLPEPAKTVMIADPSIADIQLPSDSSVFLFAQKAGITTLYALNTDGGVIQKMTLEVTHDLDGLTEAVAEELPKCELSFKTLREKLYISGSVETPKEAELVKEIASSYEPNEKNIVNRLDITLPTQVNIKVRFAEVSRTATEKLGIDWSNPLGTFGLAGSFGSSVVGAASPVTNGLNTVLGASLSSVINALNSEGLLSTLAEPNLTVMSGEEASFNAGGEIPVSVPVAADAAPAIEYKDFGVLLNVKPTVLSPNRISLKVAPTVRTLEPSTAVEEGYIFRVNKADTHVELADGQSFVLAGLFKSLESNTLNRLPMLGDLPILGALFRSTSYQRDETELVIICTVHLVKPGKEEDFVLPTDGLITASPFERLLFGTLYRKAPSSSSKLSPQADGAAEKLPPLQGAAGFYF